ncbi:hypothetical protein ACFSJU_07635 [Paradesertivirga mongoliensis]|uniref:Uncharacterized protein n=1 Tax=Paradesertivirga mongoliensis TaxID=2100740 RepID=A0ABW4ZK16_9SPHI|nr:hypothetical protein [Pedobacter mongoliensis]
MRKNKYEMIWLSFVNVKAKDGIEFNSLIDIEEPTDRKYIGAWANILVKSESIPEAIDIISQGLSELRFELVFIDKIENFMSLVEAKEVDEMVIKEADWLLKSDFVFKISDRIFPYDNVK